MAKDRRTKDQKRKDKLAKKARTSRKAEPLAYMGSKYQTDKLVPLWMQTEIGIYEAYVMTDRKLLDQTVVTAIEQLITQMRSGTLPPVTDTGVLDYTDGKEADLVIANVRRHWEEHFQEEWRPPKDKQIGVLRTILGSIEKVRSPGPRSQSYMQHIAGFLTKKLGVRVDRVSADMKRLPEPAEDELVLIGRRWLTDEDQDAKADFYELTDDLLRSGQFQRVIDTCHRLIGEISDDSSEAVTDLIHLSNQTKQRLLSSMG